MFAMSATSESIDLRSSSGSGIGHIASPARPAAAATPSRTSSELDMIAEVRLPSATSCAPVSVAMSMTRSGLSSLARASASARISRPSASVLSTSTVLPP
jgi:hypothetical protein